MSLDNFLFFFSSQFPTKSHSVKANTEETWLDRIQWIRSPRNTGYHSEIQYCHCVVSSNELGLEIV